MTVCGTGIEVLLFVVCVLAMGHTQVSCVVGADVCLPGVKQQDCSLSHCMYCGVESTCSFICIPLYVCGIKLYQIS
jgi:hypothetical protein